MVVCFAVIHFLERVNETPKISTTACLHVCDTCVNVAFSSSKALKSHMRVKHGVRTDARLFAPADARCKCCLVKFSCRPRLIAHLTDARRTSCITWMREHTLPMDSDVVDDLDTNDRELRAMQRRLGFSQPRSCGAYRQDGRRIGVACH